LLKLSKKINFYSTLALEAVILITIFYELYSLAIFEL